MRLALVTAPAALPLTLEEVKDEVDLSGEYADAQIDLTMQSVVSELDGEDGILGRALITQTWRLTMDAFPCGDEIRLPLPPLQAVTSITYTDTAGAEQTFDSADYRVLTDSNLIELAYGKTWPSTRCEREAVKITFTAGYGDDPASVPETIRHWMKLRIRELYDFESMPPHARNMIDSFRVHTWSA